jgi:hypothetical protein
MREHPRVVPDTGHGANYCELIGGKPAECKRNSWFVFSTTNGVRPFSGFSKAKSALDAEIARMRKGTGREPMPRWTLHDLRRTGRSLMSRAKVPSDHAERVLEHVIGGVRETYDRYEYLDEKRDALTRLSDLLQEIISQPKILFDGAVDTAAQLAAA